MNRSKAQPFRVEFKLLSREAFLNQVRATMWHAMMIDHARMWLRVAARRRSHRFARTATKKRSRRDIDRLCAKLSGLLVDS
jgi:hypothetical protein